MTPWTAEHQASLSFIISWSLWKLMSIESMMLSNHVILCHHLLFLPSIFPSIRVFSNESIEFFTSGGQSIGALASASVLPMNIQGWFPLLPSFWSYIFLAIDVISIINNTLFRVYFVWCNIALLSFLLDNVFLLFSFYHFTVNLPVIFYLIFLLYMACKCMCEFLNSGLISLCHHTHYWWHQRHVPTN